MPPSRDFMDRLLGKQTPEEYRAYRSATFEHARVKTLMRKTGMQDYVSHLRQHCRTTLSSQTLKFVGFNDYFPTFPMVIRTHQFSLTRKGAKATESDLYRRFTSTPFCEAFVDMYGSHIENDDRPFGLVFPRNRFVDGWIIHTYDELPDLEGIYTGRIKIRAIQPVLHTCAFNDFLKLLVASGWTAS